MTSKHGMTEQRKWQEHSKMPKNIMVNKDEPLDSRNLQHQERLRRQKQNVNQLQKSRSKTETQYSNVTTVIKKVTWRATAKHQKRNDNSNNEKLKRQI